MERANKRTRPPPNEMLVREVNSRLRRIYGISRLHNKTDPLDELIFIILSGRTQEATYLATFEALKREFHDWNDASRARTQSIASAIKFGGLAGKKSRAIKRLLTAITRKVGSADLSFLRDLDDAAAYSFLIGLPGVGPKTSRCVLVYSLDRAVFPVDAHVARIVKRLGWSKHHRLTERVQDHIENFVSPDLRLSLHVNFVVHGRLVCTERKPLCSKCVLSDLCPSAFRIDSRKEKIRDLSKR